MLPLTLIGDVTGIETAGRILLSLSKGICALLPAWPEITRMRIA